jgi:hypothetical protein
MPMPMPVSGATRVFPILGDPVAQVRAPEVAADAGELRALFGAAC